MAKDKGKKNGDEKSSKKGAKSDGFGKPSEAPAGGETWRLENEENIGKLFLITPLRVKNDAKDYEGNDTEVIVCDVVELNEKKPEKSEEHTGVWAWGGWVKGSLRGFVNSQMVLARLGQDSSKGKGKNAAWVLEDATKADEKIARAYLEAAVNKPFGKASDSDDEPKKGKKSKGDDDKKSSKKGKKK